MVRRLFSLVLNVDKDLDNPDIAAWIYEALNGAFNYYTFTPMAVIPEPERQIVYVQIRVIHFTSITEDKLRACLAYPPTGIRVVDIRRLMHGDNSIVTPVQAWSAMSGFSCSSL